MYVCFQFNCKFLVTNFFAAAGVQASKRSGDSITGELLPFVQCWCVCESRESL